MSAGTMVLPSNRRTARRHALTVALAVAVVTGALTLFRAEALPPIVDLDSTSADLTIIGLNGSNAGRAVAVGDINGDTVDDLIVGAPEADPGSRSNAGATYVFFGGPGLPATIDLASVSADVTIWGDDANDRSGYAVAADDINGDGKDDVIIGAYQADGSGSGTACGIGQVGDRCEAGETYVIYGGSNLPATIDLDSTSAGLTIFGVDTNDQSGLSVTGGDINDDGKDDVIIGAYNADGSGNGTSCGTGQVGDSCGAGEAYVILGGTNLPAIVDLNSTGADLIVFGGAPGGNMGESVASGDIIADGFDDVILGAPSANVTGEVYVIRGESVLPSVVDLGSVSADFAVFGDDTGDRFATVGVGDINGDLVEDLIVGAIWADGSGSGTSCGSGQVGDRCKAGDVYVVYGGTNLPAAIDLDVTSADLTVFGIDANDWLGTSVGAGDINSDGIDDLLMGAIFADGSGSGTSCGTGEVGDRCLAGESYVIFGGQSLPATIDLDSASADVTVFGDDASDRLGIAVAAGDINGDGVEDAIVGAYLAEPPDRSNAGEVYVLYGDCPNFDGDALCDFLDLDDDNDGCSDLQEAGLDQTLGGLRDPQYFWDFLDVYAGSPAVRDGTVSIGDIGAVVARFGSFADPPQTKAEALAEAMTAPPAAPAYHAGFDRGAGIVPGQNVWNALPPDGSVNIGDILAVVAQFGHSCA